jgi:hypothetical protein
MARKKRYNARKVEEVNIIEPQNEFRNEKILNLCVLIGLFLFGSYQSVLYFSHKPVPHFDFQCFTNLGHEMLAFKTPANFTRVPLVGILQVIIGKVVGGRSPDFTGGLLLNCILYPFIGILLWLVGRKLIGKVAIFFTVVAMINPWQVQLLTEAIVEITFLFFILITFYFMFNRSNWCYVFASLTTMVRYEGAALILAAFVLDMLCLEDKKAKLKSFVFSVLASIPLMLWMLWTALNWDTSAPTHYLKIFTPAYKSQFGDSIHDRVGIMINIKLLWQVTFSSLLIPSPKSSDGFANFIFIMSQIIAAFGFAFGSIYGLLKKQWKILALLLFVIPYFIIHAMYPYPIPRFHTTISAISLLIVLFGLQSTWKQINKNERTPVPIIILTSLFVFVVSFFWIISIFPSMKYVGQISTRSVSLPYVTILVTFTLLMAEFFIYKKKKLLNKITVLMIMTLVVVSNQFTLARVVGNGQYDIEFKYLLDWYLENARPGEKMVLTVPSILHIMAPEYKNNFIHTKDFDADNPNEFVQECRKKGITYVAWDSRMGLTQNDHFYGYWKMKNIAPLYNAVNVGPYKFITQIRVNERRYINVFRLYPRIDKAEEK